MPSPIILKTDRLIIRQPTPDDYALFEKNLSDTSIMEHQGGIMSADEVAATMNDMQRHWETHGFGRFAILLKETNRVIGFVSLKYLSDPPKEGSYPDLGININQSHRQMGLAKEACRAILEFGFMTRRFDTIGAITNSANEASMVILKKYFHYVGQEELIYNGRHYGLSEKWVMTRERFLELVGKG